MSFLLAERARSEGTRSMRAVKGSLAAPLTRGEEDWKAFTLAHGTSREIACEAIGG